MRLDDGWEPRRVDPKVYNLPAPQWILERAPRSGAAGVDPRRLQELLDEVFGHAGWENEPIHRARIEHDEVVKGKNGELRVFVTSATARITVRTADGTFSRSGTGAYKGRDKALTEGGTGAADMALKSADTNAFKRAAARIGRRFGSDASHCEYDEMCKAAVEAARGWMQATDRMAQSKLDRIAGGTLQGTNALEALDRIAASVEWTGRVDPTTTREWEKGWRAKLRELRAQTQADPGTQAA